MRSRLILLGAAAAGLIAAACGAPVAPASPLAQSPPGALSRAELAVPAGEGGGAFATPRRLMVPAGWTARVWARVPGARMEAWTPEGSLLVSQPDEGSIVELRPSAHGSATRHTLLSGLTMPQGMAFARAGGRWGRPVDAVPGPDGALYVSDDTAGAVYRLAP